MHLTFLKVNAQKFPLLRQKPENVSLVYKKYFAPYNHLNLKWINLYIYKIESWQKE